MAEHEGIHHEKGIIARNKGKIAVVATLVSAIHFGPKAYHAADDALENWKHPETQIVAGAPGQVENHQYAAACIRQIKGTCLERRWVYYFGIEQCPKDVAAAEKGEQTTSFNPNIGQIYPNCEYDVVEVSQDTWSKFPDGSTIIFQGNTNEHLRR